MLENFGSQVTRKPECWLQRYYIREARSEQVREPVFLLRQTLYRQPKRCDQEDKTEQQRTPDAAQGWRHLTAVIRGLPGGCRLDRPEAEIAAGHP